MSRSITFPITFALTLLAACLAVWPAAAESLEFSRAAIAAGEWWRVLTGHLTHWNLDHAFWDGLMFLVLGAVCERRWPRRFVCCLLASAVAISLTLWWAHADVSTYRGLSGVDTALFTLLAGGLLGEAITRSNRAGTVAIVALFAALAAKIVYEAATGTTLFVHSAGAFVPLPLAHLVGSIVGTAIAAAVNFLGRLAPAGPALPLSGSVARR